MTAPKRRWFRFSLRTMFVVLTVFALWLRWQANYIHQRRAMRARIWDEGGTVSVRSEGLPTKIGDLELVMGGTGDQPDIPAWRRWMGDEAVVDVFLPWDWPESELVRARRLFPEATVEPTK